MAQEREDLPFSSEEPDKTPPADPQQPQQESDPSDAGRSSDSEPSQVSNESTPETSEGEAGGQDSHDSGGYPGDGGYHEGVPLEGESSVNQEPAATEPIAEMAPVAAAPQASYAPAKRRRDPEPTEEPEEEEGGPVKSFLEHLEDLRWTIIKSGSSLMVAMVVCLCATKQIVAMLTWPMDRAGLDAAKILQLFNPLGGFLISLKMAFYTGMVLALPFILYFIGEFVVPALKAKEKKFFSVAFGIGTGFFVAGVVFCYFILLPFSLKALVRYNQWIGFSTETWRAEEFFDFATKFMLGVGFLFEVPVLLLSLIRLEIIKHEWLVKGRSYMFVVNFGLCAVMTPADLLTTFMMAFVLQLIYEGCILISKYWDRQRRQRLEAEAGLRQGSDQPSSMD